MCLGLFHVLRQTVNYKLLLMCCVYTPLSEVPLPTLSIPSPSLPTAAPVEYTKVVLPQKMLKLLISDYEVALEMGAGQGGVVTEGEEWEDDEDVDDIDTFSALLAGKSCMCVCVCACVRVRAHAQVVVCLYMKYEI